MECAVIYTLLGMYNYKLQKLFDDYIFFSLMLNGMTWSERIGQNLHRIIILVSFALIWAAKISRLKAVFQRTLFFLISQGTDV